MIFHFYRYGLSPKEWVVERLAEMLPAITSWTILLSVVALSFFDPISAAIIIIVFDFYFLLRLFYITLFLILSYFRLSTEDRTDWLKRIREIDRWVQDRVVPPSQARGQGLREEID